MTAKLFALVRSIPPVAAAVVAAFGALCLWAYWPTLAAMGQKWLNDPQYSHGYLVPAFAVVLLWLRRGRLAGVEWQPTWWGVAFVAAGLLVRAAGTYLYFDWLDGFSLLPCLAGLCLLAGGWRALKWAWPSVAFLVFMIPLPFRVETALAHPLQKVATIASTYVLQTLGFTALAEGNTILLDHGRIGVVEACSGLSMMLIFLALSTAVAVVIRRPLLDRIVILLSAFPIAVIANVTRITVTGIAQELVSPEAAHALFHDWAGWLMMPFALLILWGELWLLSRLLVERPAAAPVAAPLGWAVPAAAPARKGKRKSKRGQGIFPTLRRG